MLAMRALALVWALAACVAASEESLQQLLGKAGELEGWLVATRRAFHAHPELMYQESNTSAAIRAALDEMGIPYQ